MKFTLSWLKDHLDTQAPLEEITDTLTMIGLEVEHVYDPAKTLAAFSVARIVEAQPHPDADKLRLCKVEVLLEDTTQIVQIVCGAPNAKTGLYGIFAPPGSVIPANGMVLKPVKIRGIESNGMLCSEQELEISDSHSGIIALEAPAPVGQPAAQALGLDDPVMEIAITPNRPDCLGVRGIARDLAAAGIGKLKPVSAPEIATHFDCPVTVTIEAPQVCPHFTGRMVRGVKNIQSPSWLQTRLRAIGLRPINALVDITNYIAYDRGQPVHVYDADCFTGNIEVRFGAGEHFQALDGKEYRADPSVCVIADGENILGFGGIMGGAASGATQATTDVFIESAFFNPQQTAKAGRKINIVSDVRYRFERGIDPGFVEEGCDLATDMVLKLCGGKASRRLGAGAPPAGKKTIRFDPGSISRLTSLVLEKKRIVSILETLGFSISSPTGPVWDVHVPSWRPDIFGEAALIEEIVRIHGLNTVVPVPLPGRHAVTLPVLTPAQKRVQTARRILATRGLLEAVNWSFIPEKHARLFGGGKAALEIANPASVEMNHMRPSLLPGLIAATGRNMARGLMDFGLFEVGHQYLSDDTDGQKTVAAGIRQGKSRLENSGRHWNHTPEKVSFFDAKSDAFALLESLGVTGARLQTVAEAPEWYHPGRSGVVRLGPKNCLAVFGELHPRVLEHMNVEGPVIGFEVYLQAVPLPKNRATKTIPPLHLEKLQPVRRDFAFIADTAMQASVLMKAAGSVDRKLVTQIVLFDVFEGPPLPEGKKSLGLEITFQPRTHTLTDEEIEEISGKIVKAVEKASGATLRS